MAGASGDPPDQQLLEGVAERLDLSPARTTDFLVKRDVPKDIAKQLAKDYALKPREGVAKTGPPPKRNSVTAPAPAPRDVIKAPTATATIIEETSESEGSIEGALMTLGRFALLPFRACGKHASSWRAYSVKWGVVVIIVGLFVIALRLNIVPWDALSRPAAVAPPVEVAPRARLPTPLPASPTAPEPEPSWAPRVTYGDGTEVSTP
jgi:hypothetical protein